MDLKKLFSLLFLLMMVGTASADYVLQVEALTSSPSDGVTAYLGNYPQAPTSIGGVNRVYFPAAGTISRAEIYDYSGTAGTNEVYQYFVIINNTTSYRISNVSAAANERIFSNTSMGVAVNVGDYFEIQRIHPTWATNPLTNIVGGYIVVNTSTVGYALWGQGLSNTPANNTLNYIGGRPVAPSTAGQTNKIYVPADGNITDVYVTEYSQTAGSNQTYGWFMERNGGAESPVMNISSPDKLRLFNKTGMSLNVNPGDFIEFKRKGTNWTTNPLSNTIGATAFVSTTGSSIPNGYPIWVQALTSSPTDGQTIYFGNRPIAPSTTAATNKVYFRQAGIIKKVEIYCYSGTAGTPEMWSLYLRKNNADDYLISENNISASERLFKNLSMNIPVANGDYFEVKGVQPTWATNPATTIYGGYLWFEYGAAGGCPVCPPAGGNSTGYSTTAVQDDSIFWTGAFVGLMGLIVVFGVTIRR
jgi:hypothetical protein